MLSAIVLAAGSSRRMEKSNKLLLPCGGKTILTRVLANILSAGINEVIVVTGHESAQVSDSIRHLPVQIVYNARHAAGMTGSIQTGVRVATGNGFMICMGDMIHITPEEYGIIKISFERQYLLNGQVICLPQYQGKNGNPVVFSDHYRPAIMQHPDPEGCKGIVRAHETNIYNVEMPAGHILQDIDTPDDYRSLSAPPL